MQDETKDANNNEEYTHHIIIEYSIEEESNELQKDLSENSKNHLSSININLQSASMNNTTLYNLYKQMKDNKSPYRNKEEIQEIKLKDKDTLSSDEKIETYLKSIPSFNDNKFNKCKKCKDKINNYFCTKCRENLCENCYNSCKNRNHYLINLDTKKKEIDYYKKYINSIISKCVFQVSKNEQSIEKDIEKKHRNYNDFDESDINNDIEENINNYTIDILLIQLIIEKNYINYFHYKNIEECYVYIKEQFADYYNPKLDFDEYNESDMVDKISKEKNSINKEIIKKIKDNKEFKESLEKIISNGIKSILTNIQNEIKICLDSLKEYNYPDEIKNLQKKYEMSYEKYNKIENIIDNIYEKIVNLLLTLNDSDNFNNLQKINLISVDKFEDGNNIYFS